MNQLEATLQDLELFIQDGVAEELTTEEKLINENEASEDELCARIDYGPRGCGFTKSGRQVYVFNKRNDKRVRATVKVKWKKGNVKGELQTVKVIPAGGKVALGCSRSTHQPVIEYEHSVIGCEVL